MAEIRTGLAEGALRAARAVVTVLGGAQVLLRVPLPPVAGDDGELLGLRAPEFEDRPLAPVALSATAKGVACSVAADALEALLGETDAGAVDAALRAVAAVVVGDRVMVLDRCERVEMQGCAYLYQLELRSDGSVEGD